MAEEKKEEKEQAASAEEAREKEEKKEPTEEEIMARLREELDKLTIKDIVIQMMSTLSSLGYQKLGLPESTNEKYKDLNQARLAIDSLAGLVSACEKNLPADDFRAFKSTLAHLQITYVKKAG